MLVDAGNLLFNRPRVEITRPGRVGVETMAAAYRQMKYDGVAVGPYDLAAGLDVVLTAGTLGVPWISANLADLNGTLLFAPYRSVSIDTLRVAVIGLTSEDTDPAGDYQVLSVNETLSGLLETVSGDHDLIVVLSNGTATQATRLAEEFPAIDLIIGADPKRDRVPPYRTNNAVIAQCGNRGMSLGFVKARWTGQPWGIDPEKERGRLMERLASLSWQIDRLNSRKNRDQAASSRKMAALQRARKQAETELAQVTKSLATGVDGAEPSSFQALLIPLQQSFAEDPRIRELIDQGKQRALAERGKE